MPTSCSVIGCKSRANAGPKKQFFRFPQKRPKVLQQWLMVLDRLDWTPKPSSKICSDHFAPEDFIFRPNVSIPRLKPEAVPSIFPDPSSAQDEAVLDEIENTEDNQNKSFEDNDTDDSERKEIQNSKSSPVTESLDIQNQENLNKNAVKEEIKRATDDDIYPKRPRRTSKINVKMKDFILLDDFRKLHKPDVTKNKSLEKGQGVSAKLKSPEISKASGGLRTIEKTDTASKPVSTKEVNASKVDAAKELLSILEDSEDESSEPLKNKNELLNNGDSQVSSSLSSSPDNRSPSVGKAKPIKKFKSAFKSPKKIYHSGLNIIEISGRVKSASYPITSDVDSKTLKQKSKSLGSLALFSGNNAFTKIKGSDTGEHFSFLINDEKSIIAANANEASFRSYKPNLKIPMRMRTKRPSTDLAKTYFPIRCGENFFYFSYADLNPIVDLSKNNILIESSGNEEEVSVSANKSKPHLKRKLDSGNKYVDNSKTDEEPEEDSSQASEDETISHSVNENDDEASFDEASESNETNKLSNSKENSINLANDPGGSVSDLGNSSDNVQPDDNTAKLENEDILPSPAKKRKKRFKTVAEIVVRTDNTKPGEVPNVSIDKINKIVDLKASKSPVKNLRRNARSVNESTNSVDFNDNLSHITLSTDIEPTEEELSRLATRITDTVKQMKLLDRIKGNDTKLTVLITTLPPVQEKEILIIKKKNVETDFVQSRELQVVISSNKANESSLHGNIVVTNPIGGYTILPAVMNNIASKPSNGSEECENNSQDQEHPTIVCFQDKSGNIEASQVNPVLGEDTASLETPNDTVAESEENDKNSGEAIIHDHPYISPSVKYLLTTNPNVSINLAEVQQPKEPPSTKKLSENEIIFRNKVSKKLRTMKENIQKKNDAIIKLKDKIKYLERSLKEVKRNRKNPLKAMKKESASLLKNDLFYGVEQLVDTSDFSNTMDYSLNNIGLPIGLDENGEESDDDGERECASPITYLCEPAIEVPGKDRETVN